MIQPLNIDTNDTLTVNGRNYTVLRNTVTAGKPAAPGRSASRPEQGIDLLGARGARFILIISLDNGATLMINERTAAATRGVTVA